MALRTALVSALAAACVALGTVVPAPSAPAAAAPTSCGGRPPVVVLPDFASGVASVEALAGALERAGRCVAVLPYGPPSAVRTVPGLAGPVARVLGGLDAIDRSVRELRLRLARAAGRHRRLDVVGIGAGSLVALRYLQTTPAPVRVGTLVAVGALWRGTNVAGLGDLEQASRDAGTYDAVLALEQLALDPVCASCREMLRGSDFMRALARSGLRVEGTRTVSIVSRSDGLVVPWTSGRLPGTTTHVVQQVRPGHRASHFELPGDAVVRRLVLRELGS